MKFHYQIGGGIEMSNSSGQYSGNENKKEAWHALSIDETSKKLEVLIEQGLKSTDVVNRVKKYGLNVLEEEKELVDEIAILSPTYQKEHNLQNLVYNHMLLHHPHVIITPHNAFNSREALTRIIQTTIENIKAFASGRPQNTVT